MNGILDNTVRFPRMQLLVDFNNLGFGKIDEWEDITDNVLNISASVESESELLGGISTDLFTFTLDNTDDMFSNHNKNSPYHKKIKSKRRFILRTGFSNEELRDSFVGYTKKFEPNWRKSEISMKAVCPMDSLKKKKPPKKKYKDVKLEYLVTEILKQANIDEYFTLEIPKTTYKFNYFRFNEDDCFNALKKLMQVAVGQSYFEGSYFRFKTKLAMDYQYNDEPKHFLTTDNSFELDEVVSDSQIINKIEITSEHKEVLPIQVLWSAPENLLRVDNELSTYEGNADYIYVNKCNLPLYWEDGSEEITISNITNGMDVPWEVYNAELGRIKLSKEGKANVNNGDRLSISYTYQSLALLPGDERLFSLSSDYEVYEYKKPDIVAWDAEGKNEIPYSETPDQSGTLSLQHFGVREENDSAEIRLKNNTNDTITISTLQLRGYPIQSINPLEVHNRNDPSIEEYEEQKTSIQNDYINNLGLAELMSQFIIDNYAFPKTELKISVPGYPELLLGDISNVKDPKSGLDENFTIKRVDHAFDESNGWTTSLDLIELEADQWYFEDFDGESYGSRKDNSVGLTKEEVEDIANDVVKSEVDDLRETVVNKEQYEKERQEYLKKIEETEKEILKELNEQTGDIGEHIRDLDELSDELKGRTNEIDDLINDQGKDISEMKLEIDDVSNKVIASFRDIERIDDSTKENTAEIGIQAGLIEAKLDSTTYQTDKSGILSDIEANKTLITATSERVDLSVTKEEFNALGTGGKNLLYNSTWNDGVNGWTSTLNSQYQILPPEEDKPDSSILKITSASTTTQKASDVFPIEPEKEYVVSFDLKIDEITNDTDILFLIRSFDKKDNNSGQADSVWQGGVIRFNEIDVANEWVRMSLTVKPSAGKWMRVIPYNASYRNKVIASYYREVMVSRGNIELDWSPATEDVSKQISKTESSLSVLAEGITAKAEKTEVYTRKQIDDSLGKKIDESVYSKKVGELDVNINGIKGSVSDVSSTVDKLNGDIKSNKSDLAKLDIKAGKIEADVSSISSDLGGTKKSLADLIIEAGKIKSSVSDVRIDLDGLEIGGRNLLIDSSFAEGISKWTASGSAFTVDKTKQLLGKNTVKFLYKSGNYPMLRSQMVEVKDTDFIGKEATLSVYVFVPSATVFSTTNQPYFQMCTYQKTTQTNNTSFKSQYIPNSIERNKWVKLSITGIIPATDGGGKVTYISGLIRWTGGSSSANDNKTTFWYGLPKMEFGKATDWTPAPEDIEKRMSSAETSIEQTAKSITSMVKKTDYNGKTIASLIEQTASSVTIGAEKINFDGHVFGENATFSGVLSSDNEAVKAFISAASSGLYIQTKNETIVNLGDGSLTINRKEYGDVLGHEFDYAAGFHFRSISQDTLSRGKGFNFNFMQDTYDFTGVVKASEFSPPSSSRKTKRDIESFNYDALTDIISSDAYLYRYKTDEDDRKLRLSPMIEETPNFIHASSGDTMELYSFSGFLWRGVQQLGLKDKKQDGRITDLELENKMLKVRVKELEEKVS